MPVTFVPACERLFARSMYRGWLYSPYPASRLGSKRSKRNGIAGGGKRKEGWIFWEEEEIESYPFKSFSFDRLLLRFVKGRNMADSRDSILRKEEARKISNRTPFVRTIRKLHNKYIRIILLFRVKREKRKKEVAEEGKSRDINAPFLFVKSKELD